MAARRVHRHDCISRRSQPTARPVPNNSVPDLAGYRKPNPNFVVIHSFGRIRFSRLAPLQRLQNQSRGRELAAGARDLKKFATPL